MTVRRESVSRQEGLSKNKEQPQQQTKTNKQNENKPSFFFSCTERAAFTYLAALRARRDAAQTVAHMTFRRTERKLFGGARQNVWRAARYVSPL